MMRWRSRVLGVGLAALAGVGIAASARGDDRATAEAILAPLGHDATHSAVAADALKKSRDALERATRMRDANDEPRARLAEVLGRQWAEVARDMVRVADAERTARDARALLDDAGAHAERERSLLEEAIARQGRLRAELEGLDRTRRGPDRTAPAGAILDAGPSQAPAARPRGTAPRGGMVDDAGSRPGADAGLLP